jgi:hypothetical protein
MVFIIFFLNAGIQNTITFWLKINEIRLVKKIFFLHMGNVYLPIEKM